MRQEILFKLNTQREAHWHSQMDNEVMGPPLNGAKTFPIIHNADYGHPFSPLPDIYL